mmetsp:Transcript_29031/g.76588  ORF Transcript_29031/g.76588 Transcript_29031/m.76588 type:complete len:240 (-) Transcript_29031:79-798(-)
MAEALLAAVLISSKFRFSETSTRAPPDRLQFWERERFLTAQFSEEMSGAASRASCRRAGGGFSERRPAGAPPNSKEVSSTTDQSVWDESSFAKGQTRRQARSAPLLDRPFCMVPSTCLAPSLDNSFASPLLRLHSGFPESGNLSKGEADLSHFPRRGRKSVGYGMVPTSSGLGDRGARIRRRRVIMSFSFSVSSLIAPRSKCLRCEVEEPDFHSIPKSEGPELRNVGDPSRDNTFRPRT